MMYASRDRQKSGTSPPGKPQMSFATQSLQQQTSTSCARDMPGACDAVGARGLRHACVTAAPPRWARCRQVSQPSCELDRCGLTRGGTGTARSLNARLCRARLARFWSRTHCGICGKCGKGRATPQPHRFPHFPQFPQRLKTRALAPIAAPTSSPPALAVPRHPSSSHQFLGDRPLIH